ncbi:MAG TPA: CdaR family protein, partial [Thermoanaerobaculia bacterium]|nr:CdaR family protein [Thermoanaerobaculia bacterium]
MKNLGIKVLALLLAFAVWFVVSAPRRERVREKILTAPISLVAMRSDLVITTAEIPASVTVRVRGRASDLRSLTPALLDVPVDLSWITQAGEVEVTLQPQSINVPPEIEVVTIV